MLEFPDQRDPLTERVIGCAIEVHRVLGPGLLEASYEAALAIEFQDAKLHFQQQVIIPVHPCILQKSANRQSPS
jgi:GxxExxY protein